MKKGIALLLSYCMCFSMFPVNNIHAEDIQVIENNTESTLENEENPILSNELPQENNFSDQQVSEDNTPEEVLPEDNTPEEILPEQQVPPKDNSSESPLEKETSEEQTIEQISQEESIEQISQEESMEQISEEPSIEQTTENESLFVLSNNFDGLDNVAKNGIATADGTDPGFTPDKAIDGDTTSRTSRWAANETVNAPSWLQIDLKKAEEIKGFRIYWERLNIDKYKVETSNDGINWNTEKAMTTKPSVNPDEIVLDSVVNARYVRLYIENVTETSADDAINYLSTSVYEFEIYATPSQEETGINIARNAIPTANASEVDFFGPDKAIDGKKKDEPTADGKQSRWSSSYGIGEKWLQLDFDKIYEVNELKIFWERRNVTDYEILYSETGFGDDWKVAKTCGRPEVKDEVITLATPIQVASIRLHIKNFEAEDPDKELATYPTMSIWEFEIYGTDISKPLPEPPVPPLDANIALNKIASASDVEVSQFGPEKSIDGNKGTRWASNTQKGTERWWKVDLKYQRDIKKINIYWERRNVLDYEIQISNDDEQWKTVYHQEGTPDSKRQSILLDKAESTRYLQIKVNNFQDEDPDGAATWHSVSIYEVEIYQSNVYQFEDALADLTIPTIGENDTKLPMPTIPGDTEGKYGIEFCGADYEQVIDRDGTIYTPLVDTEVTVNYKVYEKNNPENFGVTPNLIILVPGQFKSKGDNAKPLVSPELCEWYGYSGDFTLKNTSKIIINSTYADKLRPMAEVFASDYTEITGRNITISTGSKPGTGDFYFTLGKNNIGLGKEGYFLTIDDGITVEAEHETGAYWSTRSILQILKQTGKTIPKGVTRDYPKFQIRSFMLDVARKPFDPELVQDIMKNMSWYKLNDFQIHLNDNYIFLEEYTEQGLDPMEAYSGFRLESDVVGENGVKLTSEDMYYTKEWFGKLIDDSKIRGIDIIPEFDTPAHSLSFTKLRPDLKVGNNGRENDHLDIKNHMGEVVELIQGIFNEYLEGPNPTFRQDTIVHVGTDEFNGDGKAFMEYTRIMTEFIKATGRTVRIWGSLSSAKVENTVNPENVQMNLWYPGYADPEDMYNEGFKLINMLDGTLYMVPDAGYYHDYLDSEYLYDSWSANNFGRFIMPIGSEQMLGAAFAVWNDSIDLRSNGIAQYDVYDRVKDALPVMAEKLWGNANDKNYEELTALVEKLGEAPNSNPRHQIKAKNDMILKLPFDDSNDYSGNKYNGTLNNAELTANGQTGGGLNLKGASSYFELPLENMGIGTGEDRSSSIEFWAKKEAGNGEQIIFESDKGAIKASQKGTGKLGFSREEYDYSFNYSLPENTWVKIKLNTSLERQGSTAIHKTDLYVNDGLVDSLFRERTGEKNGLNSTLIIPLERIGSKTDAFKGEIDGVQVYRGSVTPTPSVMLKQTISTAQKFDSTMYETTSVNAMEAALKAAIAIGEKADATQSEIELAIANLANTIDGLKLLVPGAKTELQELIAQAQALDQSKYDVQSWTDMQTALNAAIAVRDNENAIQSEIDTAVNNLKQAIENLKPITINKDSLKEQIQKAQTLNPVNYDASLWLTMQNALKAAITIRDKADATQSEIDTAVNNLKQAINNLKSPSGGDDSSNKNNNSGSSSGGGSSLSATKTASGDKLPAENTGVTPSASSIIKPVATITDNQANVLLSAEDTKKVIEDMIKNKSNNIIIQPDIKEEVSKVVINIPSQNMTDIKDKTTTNITIKTKLATILISNKSFEELSGSNEDISISVENKSDGTMDIQIKLGSTIVNTIKNGIKVSVPVSGIPYGMVAQAIASNGTKTLINKSVLLNNELCIPLDGTATFNIIDNSKDFDDIKNYWAENSIDFVTARELFQGTSENTFGPEEGMTRGMMVTVLHRLENTPKANASSFSDVSSNAYYADAVAWASSNEIVSGTGEGFSPEQKITREQIAVIIYNYSKVIGMNMDSKGNISSFVDSSSVSSWSSNAMEYAVGSGLISGKSGKKLDPQGTATRAEVASIINRFVENIAKSN